MGIYGFSTTDNGDVCKRFVYERYKEDVLGGDDASDALQKRSEHDCLSASGRLGLSSFVSAVCVHFA